MGWLVGVEKWLEISGFDQCNMLGAEHKVKRKWLIPQEKQADGAGTGSPTKASLINRSKDLKKKKILWWARFFSPTQTQQFILKEFLKSKEHWSTQASLPSGYFYWPTAFQLLPEGVQNGGRMTSVIWMTRHSMTISITGGNHAVINGDRDISGLLKRS